MFLEPTLFDRYIAMDPALSWKDRELVNKAAERLPDLARREIMFWFTTGTTPEFTKTVNLLAETLESDAPDRLRWKFDRRPEEQLTTIFRATKADAFRWTLWKN